MFPSRFFPDRYFAPRYWPKTGEDPSAEPVTYCLEASVHYVPGLEAVGVDTYVDPIVPFVPGGHTINGC